MVDSDANKSSAQKANYTVGWIFIKFGWNENATEPLAENYGEIQTYIEGLRSEISRSSTVEVQAKLCKDTTGKLYSKRDDMISNFPKDKPLRRITRTGDRG